MLKCLEGESSDTIGAHLFHMKERALPDLGANIKCGNSLIAPDFYDDTGPDELTTDYRLKINAFDWAAEFPDIFADGGFDIVIGNPPYLSYSGRQAVEIDARTTEYYDSSYSTTGWITSHGLFIERAATLLCKRYVGFIVPDQVAHLEGYSSARRILCSTMRLTDIKSP